MHHDAVFHGFLERQLEEGLALSAASDLVQVSPCDGPPPRHYLVELRCRGLVQLESGAIEERDRFLIGVSFPSDYLRRAHAVEVLTLLAPLNVFHPNVRRTAMCIGRLAPGTRLVDLVYQCFELLSYMKVTMREDDALNREACAWARGQAERFPIDRRPLKRRSVTFDIEERTP